MKSYWASADDPFFEVGHYVEQWELDRIRELSPSIRALLESQARLGNKVRSISKHLVQLSQPLGLFVQTLPDGLVFWTPLQHESPRVLDGDEDGAVVCQSTGVRVYPTGFELEPPYWSEQESPPSAA